MRELILAQKAPPPTPMPSVLPPVAVPQAPAQTAPVPTAEDVEKAEKRIKDIKERIEVATGKPVEAPSVVSSATGSRILDFIVAVAYRAGVVPMQVASWHYRYAEEHGRPGLRAFPVISGAAGGRIIMGITVHDAYYPIVSGGDRTATGTTPVSFILGYPAWLGPMGIVLMLACIMLFDSAVVVVLAWLKPALRWAGVGLFSIASYNMMMSEFTTVMISHGAAAALLVLTILGLVGRWTNPPASEKTNE